MVKVVVSNCGYIVDPRANVGDKRVERANHGMRLVENDGWIRWWGRAVESGKSIRDTLKRIDEKAGNEIASCTCVEVGRECIPVITEETNNGCDGRCESLNRGGKRIERLEALKCRLQNRILAIGVPGNHRSVRRLVFEAQCIVLQFERYVVRIAS